MMKKSLAIKTFGNQRQLARAMELTDGAISQWPEVLTRKQSDWVRGCAMRKGVVPKTKAFLR